MTVILVALNVRRYPLWMATLFVLSFGFLILSTSQTNASNLQTCLQKRLDAVLSGESLSKHLDVKSLLYLTIRKGNYLRIKDDSVAMERFEKAIITMMQIKIGAKGKDYVGSKIIIHSEKKQSAEGSLRTKDGTSYNFGVTFASENCKIRDINIAGGFVLNSWVANQSEIQALMKEYKMKR